MDVSNVLKGMRQGGYGSGPGKKDDAKKDENHSENTRMVKLSDDEVKGLEPYQVSPGEEIVLEMTGKLEEDGHFHIMSVKYADGESEMSDQVAKGLIQ